jgi:hypothetical protein
VPHRTQQLLSCYQLACLSCHLAEELLVAERCENLRSKISKIPMLSFRLEAFTTFADKRF